MNTQTPRARILTVFAVLVLATAGFVAWRHHHPAGGHSHAHGDAAESVLALNDGQRWETDAPLRAGMRRIRDAALPVLAAHARGGATAPQAEALAATVQEQVNYMIANCKLAPKADATLHVFITDLVTGSAMLAKDPASSEAATLIDRALQQYPKYFDDPTWKALPAAAVKS